MNRLHLFRMSMLMAWMCISSLGMVMAQNFNGDTIRYSFFKKALFYDVYNGKIFDADKQDGILRLSNSRYAVPISSARLDSMGRHLKLEVRVNPSCDNYDRIGCVSLAFVPKGTTTYSDKNCCRMEIARFITPFMDMNKLPNEVPYDFDVSFLSPLFHDKALRDTTDIWMELTIEGVPYAANSQIAGCEGRSDVFYGTLSIVSDAVAEPATTDHFLHVFDFQRYVNNYKASGTDEPGQTVATYTLQLDEPMADGQFLLITSNHGANSGGEEYNRRLHYVFINDWMALVYRPGRPSCEPFRQYNTQSNGIYGGAPQSDASWQSFSNWCPGDKIDNRIIHLGALDAGTYTFRLLVPDAVFNNGEGYFPVSLAFQGVRHGQLSAIRNLDAETPVSTLQWQGSQLSVLPPQGQHVQGWTLCDSQGQRLMVQPGTPILDLSRRPSGVYLLILQMEDGTIETHKFFSKNF